MVVSGRLCIGLIQAHGRYTDADSNTPLKNIPQGVK
jgi:hypothetical protein